MDGWNEQILMYLWIPPKVFFSFYRVDHQCFLLQRDMVKILRSSNQWIKSGGRDHIVPLHHPNAFRHYRDKVNSSIFIVADFGRTMNIAKLAKDVVAPYAHMVESYFNDDEEDPYDTRKTLLFFRGRTKRKEVRQSNRKDHISTFTSCNKVFF